MVSLFSKGSRSKPNFWSYVQPAGTYIQCTSNIYKKAKLYSFRIAALRASLLKGIFDSCKDQRAGTCQNKQINFPPFAF